MTPCIRVSSLKCVHDLVGACYEGTLTKHNDISSPEHVCVIQALSKLGHLSLAEISLTNSIQTLNGLEEHLCNMPQSSLLDSMETR